MPNLNLEQVVYDHNYQMLCVSEMAFQGQARGGQGAPFSLS